MDRIILHWTAGADGVNAQEADSYNFIVARDGKVVRGTHPPEAQTPNNVARGSAYYAAHTLNCNSNSIGVSLDAMGGAIERPFTPGRYPITEEQLGAAAALVAGLCVEYRIPVTRRTVLTHAEVQRTLGIKQRNKWDISWLPGMPEPGDPIEVGDALRAMISAKIDGGAVAGAAYTVTLRMGSRGDAVSHAQQLLKAHGNDVGTIDGIFGQRTDTAVRIFQKLSGLKPDGIVGAKTWAALNEDRKK